MGSKTRIKQIFLGRLFQINYKAGSPCLLIVYISKYVYGYIYIKLLVKKIILSPRPYNNNIKNEKIEVK